MSKPRTDIHEFFIANPKPKEVTDWNYIKWVCKQLGEKENVILKQFQRHYPKLMLVAESRNKKGEVTSQKFSQRPQDEITDLQGYEANKLTTNPYGGQWVRYERKETDYLAEIKALLSEYKPTPIKGVKPVLKEPKRALKITFSDMHIGLSTKNDLFGYTYNETNIKKAFKLVLDKIAHAGTFDEIILQDLGDSLDGYNKMTTRGGHELEQDLSNTEAFRLLVKLRLDLIGFIHSMNICNRIVLLNVSNCNHSGDFGYFANYTISLMAEKLYSNVTAHTYENFIGAYTYGIHTFLSCHGKDKKHMRGGLPVKLDDKTKNFIMSYINRHGIANKCIHFEKGDLHQLGFSKCKEFDYRNFMSFAPPSNWVQHNFGDTYSGFSMQVIDKDTPNIQHTDIFLNYDN